MSQPIKELTKVFNDFLEEYILSNNSDEPDNGETTTLIYKDATCPLPDVVKPKAKSDTEGEK